MSSLEKIVDQLSSLTVIEAAELSKLLEEKWGVSAAAPVAMAAPAAGAAPAAAEQTDFTVVLVAAGEKKIEVIKAVREVRSDLGLKEAVKHINSFKVCLENNMFNMGYEFHMESGAFTIGLPSWIK